MNLRRWKKLLCFVGMFFLITTLVLLRRMGGLNTRRLSEEDDVVPGSVLILILSTFNNHARRQTIRDTWLRVRPFPGQRTFQHFFAIAVDDLPYEKRRLLLLEDSAKHDLLLLSGTSDDYHSLTLKVKLSMKWLHQNLHRNFQYLIKVDDDSFVQLPSLYDYLIRLDKQERLYLGFFYGRGQPRRYGKWQEQKWFLCAHYLPHAHGGGYLISRDLVKFVADNAHILTDYANEDVSLGTWLAPLDILRVHEPLFDTEYRSRGCNNGYLVSHKLSVLEMQQRYSNLVQHGRMCNTEKALFPSYRYNWSVNPLQCCQKTWEVP